MPTSLIKETDVDVLVIGAGPAGVMAGNALVKAGINVRIIDQRPVKVMAGQADGIQPRTLEVLQSYGLAERLFKEGNQMHMAAFYNPSPSGGIELTDRVPDVTAPSARYPFEVTLHQGAIEALFLDSMKSMGVEVSRPITPVSIQVSDDAAVLQDPTAYPVRVVLKNLDPAVGQHDTEIVHAKFLLGTDGAHSWVRKMFNIAMEGEQTDYIWGVVDMIPDTDFPDIRNRCAIHSNNGSCMIIPREGDKVRLYVQLGAQDAIDSVTGRVNKNKFSPHHILEVARKSFHPYTFETPKEFDWWTLYQIGQRVASKFSIHERVFIAGDACHTHSPKAGQGMNASMNDTHNLAWKLAHVVRGWADISILKTYEHERRKYAQDLISFDKQFARLFSGKPRTEVNQDGVSHEDFIRAFQTFGGFTSGIGVHYTESAVVQTKHQSHASNLIIGQRMPPQILVRAADGRPYELHDLMPSDTRFKILVFAGNTTVPQQLQRVRAFSDQLFGDCTAQGDGLLARYVPEGGDLFTAFEILTITAATKMTVRLDQLPKSLRSHWSKVFVDDTDPANRHPAEVYAKFGINPEGVVVIVRPDGYIGMVAPFDSITDIDSYFASFMKVH
ncbi:hypothetical protein AMATHDRAFT_75697 [Amanita thiersii Skay4041]|uniref:FAD-binding domain-containing protein n=1 Tax=Amanita thiersii Skay4041 TaxID=703135 RepID=A0A2A9NRJ4_9AGAR|nr:hypothetical protein AMATHDRAFT_75697 [Amanita thiersii Skay4041]